MSRHPCIAITGKSALIIVDVQNDFMPGGALPVPHGDEVVPVLNRYIELFREKGLPVFATRDWHPPNHISFKSRGGPWPPHCVQGTWGAEFHPDLRLPKDVVVVSKATDPDKEAYSGFQGTGLKEMLLKRGVRRVFIGGLATDYCVRSTVLDAIKLGFEAVLLLDGSRGVDVRPGDTARAVREMLMEGAVAITLDDLL